jgi:hypothetical protein
VEAGTRSRWRERGPGGARGGGGRPRGADGTGVEQLDGGRLDARRARGLERRGAAGPSESAPSLEMTNSEAMGVGVPARRLRGCKTVDSVWAVRVDGQCLGERRRQTERTSFIIREHIGRLLEASSPCRVGPM